jgi:hypothetical protein
LQVILNETDRQENSNSLELVNCELSDVILPYLLEHIRVKKYKFTQMKFVKNCITDEGLKLLLGYLLNNNSVQVLNMTSNLLSSRSL